MARIARVVLPGFPFHITQKGNFGQDVFFDDEDRSRYLKLIRVQGRIYGTRIWAYCLMKNHVHFIAVPSRENSLALTFGQAHMRYSQHLNLKLGRKGHVWQARFYSCILDEAHLHAAVRYVERNPVRIGVVDRPWDYVWSSARSHSSRTEDPLIAWDCPLLQTIADWQDYLSPPEEAKMLESLRHSFRNGRPAGSKEFVQSLESILKRSLGPGRPGRPKKRRNRGQSPVFKKTGDCP